MTFSPENDFEKTLAPFLKKLISEGLSSEESQKFNRLLAESEAARRYYRDYLTIEVMLQVVHTPVPQVVLPPLSSAVQLDAAPADAPPPRLLRPVGLSRLWRPQPSLSYAALVLLATGWLWFWLLALMANRGQDSAVTTAPPSAAVNQAVAQVVQLTACEWKHPTAVRQVGGELHSGENLQLISGVAELQFRGGSQVLVRGPAELTLVAAGAAELRRGQLTVRVPDQARGFWVQTPHARIVDLGTEFGLVVDSQGETQVDVFHGRVLVQPEHPAAEKVVVNAGRGVDVLSVEGDPLLLRPCKSEVYVRAFAAPTSPAAPSARKIAEPAGPALVLAHWTFENLPLGPAQALTRVVDQSGFGRDAWIEGQPVVTAGPDEYGGAALRFVTEGDSVVFRPGRVLPDTPRPAGGELNFERPDSFTIEAVLRNAPEAQLAGAIVSKDWAGNQPSWWLRLNQGWLEGFVSDYDPRNERTSAVRSLRRVDDGRWHHIAFVRDAAARRLRIYIDHQLDAAADDASVGNSSNTQDIRLGAFNTPGRQFLGELGTVRISLGALEPEEFIQPRPEASQSHQRSEVSEAHDHDS